MQVFAHLGGVRVRQFKAKKDKISFLLLTIERSLCIKTNILNISLCLIIIFKENLVTMRGEMISTESHLILISLLYA